MKSNLTRVTLTGADDTVDPAELIEISEAYPSVEWGILIGSQHGHRFPSPSWIISLMNHVRPLPTKPNLSLHICGRHLKRIAAGKPLEVHDGMLDIFQRCQLNWHAEPQGEISANVCHAFNEMKPWNPEVIFQLDGENNKLPIFCGFGMKKMAGLFDLSHGAGVLPEQWPHTTGNTEKFPIGYAGGLGPDNIREELPKIHAAASGDYWIDMETKVFDGLQFSLPKCVEVLKIVEEFNDDKK